MMQRIFYFGLVAIAASCLAQPLHAGGGGVSGGVSGSAGGGHSGVGGSFHAGSAGAHIGGAGFHGGSVTHFGSSGGAQIHGDNFVSQPREGVGGLPVIHPNTNIAPTVPPHIAPTVPPLLYTNAASTLPTRVNRAFVPARLGDPTVAFGGGFNSVIRRGGRAFSPPGEITSRWNRDRVHTWNHHRYRCFNGGWIIADDWPYDYYGNADNDQPYSPYPQPYPPYANGAIDNGESVANNSLATDGSDYGTPDTLIVSVQDALTHLGYATGVSDGRFGSMTETALANFQRDHNLPVTGHIDGMTLRALGLL